MNGISARTHTEMPSSSGRRATGSARHPQMLQVGVTDISLTPEISNRSIFCCLKRTEVQNFQEFLHSGDATSDRCGWRRPLLPHPSPSQPILFQPPQYFRRCAATVAESETPRRLTGAGVRRYAATIRRAGGARRTNERMNVVKRSAASTVMDRP